MSCITVNDRDEYGDGSDGQKYRIGTKRDYAPSIELIRFNFDVDRIPKKRWAEARDWILFVAHSCANAVEDEQKRQIAEQQGDWESPE